MPSRPDPPAHLPPRRHALLLLPPCPLLATAALIDALAAANEVLDRLAHLPVLLSIDGQAVRSPAGPALMATDSLPAQALGGAAFDVVWVLCERLPTVSGEPALPAAQAQSWARVQAWLRAQVASGAMVAGIGTGATLLAQAGLLEGYRAALPWAHVAQGAQAHPGVLWSAKLFEIDRQRLSCAGGTATLDLLITWLGQQHGDRLAQALVGHFGLERLRGAAEHQTAPVAARIGGGSAKLAEAVALMEANLGEPLPTEDIARLVGVSRRQLERLFKQHLDELPSRYYAELRLVRSRRLLQQTSQSILQVGLACGFATGSHFSNAYRARFGHTPREARSPRAQAWRDQPASPPPPPQETLP